MSVDRSLRIAPAYGAGRVPGRRRTDLGTEPDRSRRRGAEGGRKARAGGVQREPAEDSASRRRTEPGADRLERAVAHGVLCDVESSVYPKREQN